MSHYSSEQLDDLFERSKNDREIIVGSEVRALICDLRDSRRAVEAWALVKNHGIFLDCWGGPHYAPLLQWEATIDDVDSGWHADPIDAVLALAAKLVGNDA